LEEIRLLKASLNGDQTGDARSEDRESWRVSAVRYANKLREVLERIEKLDPQYVANQTVQDDPFDTLVEACRLAREALK
jgi:hypothetical protein